ncbi:uncharacterized protein [Notamacropus eugenii]|uniref:uncharacterized protein n=1 Tax=Notamacropus eugenii TaxID=9315 RepID=UPI003B67F6B0
MPGTEGGGQAGRGPPGLFFSLGRLLLRSKSRDRGSASRSEVHSPAVRVSSSPPPPVSGPPASPPPPPEEAGAAAAGSRPAPSSLGSPAAEAGAAAPRRPLPAGLVGGGGGGAGMEAPGEGEGAPRHTAPRRREQLASLGPEQTRHKGGRRCSCQSAALRSPGVAPPPPPPPPQSLSLLGPVCLQPAVEPGWWWRRRRRRRLRRSTTAAARPREPHLAPPLPRASNWE